MDEHTQHTDKKGKWRIHISHGKHNSSRLERCRLYEWLQCNSSKKYYLSLGGQILNPVGMITLKFLMHVFKFSDIMLIFMLNVI